VAGAHPQASLAREAGVESPEAWSREGAAIAMASAYPPYLERNAPVPKRYEDEAFGIASRQAALAGYRLALALERSLARASARAGAADLGSLAATSATASPR
jgi:hypothetical protein